MIKASPIQVESRKKIDKNGLINRINYANFNSIPFTVVLENIKINETLSLQALPKLCNGNKLELLWLKTPCINFSDYKCVRILINDYDYVLSIELMALEITESGLVMNSPKSASTLTNRRTIRVDAIGITGTIIQNGLIYKGTLGNFNTHGFLIQIENSKSLSDFNTSDSNYVLFYKDGKELYKGDCRIYMIRDRGSYRECVVIPKFRNVPKFKKKVYRGDRCKPKYPLKIVFHHPLSNCFKQLNVLNISGSGFSLEEPLDRALLFPGLIIPGVEIILPGCNTISCNIQIVYSKEDRSGKKVISGCAIIDMEAVDYFCLKSFIHISCAHEESEFSKIDIKALWRFFFESGFISPEKYKYIYKRKEIIKRVYNKLYLEDSPIFRSFECQKDEKIFGHISILRSYEKSWLLNHYASSKKKGVSSGVCLLNQVGSFVNSCHRLKNMHLDYLMCYFRAEDRFPHRVFGGLFDNINDREKCSVDDWHYYLFDKTQAVGFSGINNWKIEKSTEDDLIKLNQVYSSKCGGLMLKAFNMDDGICSFETLSQDYGKSGLTRNIELFSVKKEDDVSFIVMVDKSEAGMNMSDLINSFKIFISDSEMIKRDIIDSSLLELSKSFFEEDKIPVLINNCNRALELDLPIEKIYKLWILNMDFTDAYFHSISKILRVISH